MARDDTSPSLDPERKPSEGKTKREGARHAAASVAMRRGKSGYGIESIRPHLRAQLEQRKLWRQEFPPQPPDDGGGDES